MECVRQLGVTFAERESREPDRYPGQNLAELKQLGVLMAPFPPSLGGCGAALPSLVRLTETLAAASASTALIVTMPLGLAGIYALDGAIAPDEHRASWLAQQERVAGEYRAG